jgi:hypothetical protein
LVCLSHLLSQELSPIDQEAVDFNAHISIAQPKVRLKLTAKLDV